MKKLLSILLAGVLVLATFAGLGIVTRAAETFCEGDVLYLRIENPSSWADDATLYANFTASSRADNGDASVTIADADRSMYAPVTGLSAAGDRGVYRYTVTAADAGATVMRFWRGNAEKLWNCSVTLSAADLAAGYNTAVVTDWTDAGYLDMTYADSITATLSLSADAGQVGDSFLITAGCSDAPEGATVTASISINEELHDGVTSYTFAPTANGIYTVRAVVTAARDGRIVAMDTASATITVGTVAVTAYAANCLYAHASASDASDAEAWVKWYRTDDSYHFFLPSSAAGDAIALYSTFSSAATLSGTSIGADSVVLFDADTGTDYTFRCGSVTRTVRFHFSSAEAALFVNNTDTFDGMDFFSYLQLDKENEVAATGAVTTPDGTIENTEIKKIKGRGNTSWNADKKGYNVTLKTASSLAGMPSCKKFSLISNFQDASLARNRLLFDLSDAVGIPYASDSRFVDFYTNGEYQGSYQLCQKVDVGKNCLIDDFEEDDYLDEATGGVKDDFSFVCEIDASPADDDFHFTVRNGNNLTIKAPELSTSDENYTAVKNYISMKYTLMVNALSSGDSNLDSYIDIQSLARVYLINELGKNWDSGASSFFLTYKPDSEGNYRFFASPVWDYDNSLGNARGTDYELYRLGITDYTEPSGWFSTLKGGYIGPNFLSTAIKHTDVLAYVKRAWFEDFLPAIRDTLNATGVNRSPLYSADVYRSILTGTAEMNYCIWDLYTDTTWVADHSSVRMYTADYTYDDYGRVTDVTLSNSGTNTYDQYTFDGQFSYMTDWLNSRAAWLSAQYIDGYVPTELPSEPETEIETETEQPIDRPALDFTNAIAAWVFDATGKTSGEKLAEYGSSDGYEATMGEGTLTLSVDGESGRALEWSAAEYNRSGAEIVPIMAAGSKNLWGSPYIRMDIPAAGYESFTLTMYLAGSNRAPASWKLQAAVDGATFTDIEGATFTITTDNRKLLTAYFDRTALPAELSDSETLSLRLVPVSMTTVSGGDTSEKPSGGELALNYIIVTGLPTGDDFMLGDVDLNGTVDITDATVIQRYLAHLTPLSEKQQRLADVTHADGVDITDATVIQRYLAHFIDTL